MFNQQSILYSLKIVSVIVNTESNEKKVKLERQSSSSYNQNTQLVYQKSGSNSFLIKTVNGRKKIRVPSQTVCLLKYLNPRPFLGHQFKMTYLLYKIIQRRFTHIGINYYNTYPTYPVYNATVVGPLDDILSPLFNYFQLY